jgi:hypothetical protein
MTEPGLAQQRSSNFRRPPSGKIRRVELRQRGEALAAEGSTAPDEFRDDQLRR